MVGQGDGVVVSATLYASVAALALSFAICVLLIGFGPRDAPDGARKRQAAPVPSSGGLGIFIGAAVGIVLAGAAGPASGWPPEAGAAAALIAVMLALGLADDFAALSAKLKFAAAGAACLAAAAFGASAEAIAVPGGAVALPWAIGVAGTALFLFVAANGVNFMDGANGLAVGCFAVNLLILAAASQDPLRGAGLVGAAAAAGFLVLNAMGKIYAGDAGALAAGATLASVWLLLLSRPELRASSMEPTVWTAVTPLLPLLADVLLTLLWRARRGRPLLDAHTDHAYQRRIHSGVPHLAAAGVYAALTAGAGATALWAASEGPGVTLAAFLGVTGILTALWAAERRLPVSVQA